MEIGKIQDEPGTSEGRKCEKSEVLKEQQQESNERAARVPNWGDVTAKVTEVLGYNLKSK